MPIYNEYIFRLFEEMEDGNAYHINTVSFERNAPLEEDTFDQIRIKLKERVVKKGHDCYVMYYVRKDCVGSPIILGQISADICDGYYLWIWSYISPDGNIHVTQWKEVIGA